MNKFDMCHDCNTFVLRAFEKTWVHGIFVNIPLQYFLVLQFYKNKTQKFTSLQQLITQFNHGLGNNADTLVLVQCTFLFQHQLWPTKKKEH